MGSAVSAYLNPKLAGTAVTEEQHANADQYLLEELAFLISSRELLGCENLTYVYHKAWPIFERLMAGDYDPDLADRMGFLEVEVRQV